MLVPVLVDGPRSPSGAGLVPVDKLAGMESTSVVHENMPEWPAAPVWAETVSRTTFANSDEEVERHYERTVTVDGVKATIFENHAWGDDEETAGTIVGGGDPGIDLSVMEFTPENAEACAHALLAAVAAYKAATGQA